MIKFLKVESLKYVMDLVHVKNLAIYADKTREGSFYILKNSFSVHITSMYIVQPGH